MTDAPLKTRATSSITGVDVSYIEYKEDRLPEVTVESLENPKAVRITDFHSQVQGWPEMTKHMVVWKTEDGISIEGVLADARSNARTDSYPLIVLIHGGSASTNSYNIFLEPYFEHWNVYPIRQWYEQGISVFMPDYRGSSGYGREFKEAINRRRGELESSDILRGLDHLLAEYGFDPNRVGIAGPSYGGYLTMLMAAKYPSRFALASSLAGFVDVRLMMYTSDANWELDDLWDPHKPVDYLSPLSYIDSNCPPILLQTGELDRRNDPSHVTSFYRLLKKCGGEAKLITYKGCGHIIDHPHQLLRAQQHNLEWFVGRL